MLFVCLPDRESIYNENGYITKITYNGDAYTYKYDQVGRLISEKKNSTTTKTYSYDEYNNIQKSGLMYTNGKLTSADDKAIEYDAMGNPTKYKGNTFTWQEGRKLFSGSMNGKSFAYRYDGNGMCFKKTVNGVVTNYYYDGD